MKHSHRQKFVCALALLAATLVAACSAPTKTVVSFEPGASVLPAAGSRIVLYSGDNEQPNADEAMFLRCLEKEFSKRLPSQFSILDKAVFQDALFPWFEAEIAPRTVEQMSGLLAKPVIKDRIAALGVRYLLVVASAGPSDGFPGIICGAGYGGGGCLGVMWEDKTNRVTAVIWDLVLGVESGSLSATSTGKSIGFALGFPVLFLADTKREACRAVANELASLLSKAGGSGAAGN